MKKVRNLLLLLSVFSMVGCGGETVSSVISSPTSQESSLPAVSSAEESSESAEESSSVHTHIDYIYNDDVKLAQDYKNHTFMADGIEQVSLKTCIDGDTAHFTAADGTTIKSRFFGIDTPESTGKVQEWGHEASEFTKAKLKEAATNGTIVVSSPSDEYVAPTTDSTGSRYVSLVWVNTTTKNADYKDLVLLNLWIVQEGLSNVKNVADMARMSDTFYAAEAQAREEKLNMFSGEKSSYFNYGDYEDTSILDIKKEIETSLTDTTHVNSYNNKKVRIVGTVAGYSNNVLYIQNYYTKDEGGRYDYGEYAGVNIFTGMSAIASKYTTINTYIELTGLAQDSENYGFQLTDGQFQAYPAEDDTKNARVLIKAADNTDEYALHTFEMAPSELTNDNYEALNCSVSLTEKVKCTGGYVSDDGTEITLYLADKDGNSLPFSCYIPFVFHPASDETQTYSSIDNFKNKYFMLNGVYTFHKSSNGKYYYQINLSTNAGLTEVA